MILAQRIRIASWNINNLSEKSGVALFKNSVIREDNDYALLQKYAEQLDADIVCLQEIGSYEAIKRVFPNDKWDILYSGSNTDKHAMHTAIVIRKGAIHLLQKSYLPMDTEGLDSKAEKRRAVEILFEVDGRKIWLLDIHLKSFCFLDSIEDSYISSCYMLNLQATWLKQWVDQKNNLNMPFIIAGDFNRKINHSHSGIKDELWQKINQDNTLMRLPHKKNHNAIRTKILKI
ncbi:MAG: endonuclease/exonuclease/phosphatase family protein [Candidatus Liberibacter asiaticus]|nr:endonuclease/exonuclease/phosphatase family protein [Candidatus Liberibacter asiaticus]